MNNENKEFIKLTPFKLQVIQSFPFIDADFDALTNYEVLCKVVDYLNTTVENVDMLNTNVNNLATAFNTLYNYVHDYFDNLDVTEEINAKLDEMASDGTLANIIENYTSLPEIEEIIYDGGLDRIKATGKFLTNLSSWIGYQNTEYTSDNATRFYLIPKDHVTTGVGGCLKIFADDYYTNQDYRDLGIYFSANQNSDTGYYGNGVNWINIKVLDDGSYAGQHPDLGFSFQDGHVVAGRITCFNNSRATWVFGSGVPVLGGVALVAENQGSVGFTKGSRIRLEKDRTNNQYNDIFSNDSGDLAFSISSNKKVYIAGNLVEETVADTTSIKNALLTTNRVNVTSATSTIDATTTNRVVLGNTSNSTITSITGTDGQELTLINVGSGTTIQNNTTIHLASNTNYSMGNNSTLTLVNINGTWYEKCRSDNS